MTRLRYLLFSFTVLVVVVGISLFVYMQSGPQKFPSTEFEETTIPNPGVEVEDFVSGLEVPWAIVFLDDETALVTERAGRIRIIHNGTLQEEPYLEVNADARGEGGLMGIDKHPEFPLEPYIYVMYTAENDNRVSKIKHEGTRGEYISSIIEGLDKARNHNGGRIKFGPDGYLYITTGEQFQASASQDLTSLSGKILRITSEGEIPKDNPFGNEIYSYGHRNPQGLAWNTKGDMYSSEHGPSGEFGVFAHDEINKIRKGKNYGWPEVIGIAGKEEFEDPIIVWAEKAVPPGGMTFHKDKLYVATLRSRALIVIEFEEGEISSVERWFSLGDYEGVYGRLRDVYSHNEYIYVLTSNKDGRGTPLEGDDKILRIKI